VQGFIGHAQAGGRQSTQWVHKKEKFFCPVYVCILAAGYVDANITYIWP